MSLHPQLDTALKDGVFWITKRIGIGQFVSERRCQCLLAANVTHVLNVGEAESLSSTTNSIQHVTDIPITDLQVIPVRTAEASVRAIHDVMLLPDTKLLVHCIAGRNRSPTILWLYLLACGMDGETAKQLIVERSPDSVPGHSSLVNEELIRAIKAFGSQHAMTSTDPSVLRPAY